jgi:hypothetical protein
MKTFKFIFSILILFGILSCNKISEKVEKKVNEKIDKTIDENLKKIDSTVYKVDMNNDSIKRYIDSILMKGLIDSADMNKQEKELQKDLENINKELLKQNGIKK